MRAPGGPRLLLRRLREVMAEPVTAQARLDRIVVLIASNMVAEVCSLYVVRADGVMELFATEGLNREAVHLTTMQPGEGLVGLIASSAEPLALSDAQHHPAFSYKPETGEEIFQSFLGVPVLRGGATIGVLVVQNRARRTYSEEEVEALQTTAMLLAEMIASGELQTIAAQGGPIAVRNPLAMKGLAIADGIGLGHVVMHQPRVAVSKIVADDVDSELHRLETAISAMRASVDELIDRSDDGRSGEHRDVLEAFRMIAHDRGWLRRLREAVSSGLTAEAAVERVQNDARAKLQRQTDPYLRDRLHDLTDIANRLLHQLAGQSLVLLPEELPENAILVARSMSPAALLDYDRSRLRGLVLEEGGASSHVAIVARALSVPAVSDVPNVTEIVEHGDAIIVDGDSGEVYLRPPADVELSYAERARMRARKQAQYRALREVPTVSLDGVRIGLHMNAGLLVDMPHLAETGAESIGLFRTELQFMLAPRFPRPGVQEQFYRSILDAAGDRTVTFRTLDVGGDKLLPYMKGLEEENPALGWRALRIGLDRPALLRMQLRAFMRAAAGRDLRVMAPMVSTVEEFSRTRALFDRELVWSANHGYEPPRSAKLGAMVEVPSLLLQLDEIAARADFLSVGSNDLMQYLYAVDRDNRRVSNRYDPLSVGFLRALRSIAAAGARAGTPVTLCGEIGGRPLEAMALTALGYRHLSMSATSIGPVKAMILTLKVKAAAYAVEAMLAEGRDDASLREPLKELASRLDVRL
jgi:phosphotransferase system enzyme I (PtsP)